ncbi:type II toxin-antitoxin system RelE/ParE family toxin [Mesorhizobium sp.]|uniref:type II toxin-antitoxin system RelE/ParE family toxin n=1 Tax=Mesorhizobium sp. TaxID=1871066 RepID=UPI00345CE41B
MFELLGDYPSLGRLYEGRTHQFVHGKHIILYRMGSEEIIIGRIFHGAQRRSSS